MSGELDANELWAQALTDERVAYHLGRVADNIRYLDVAQRTALLREGAGRLRRANDYSEMIVGQGRTGVCGCGYPATEYDGGILHIFNPALCGTDDHDANIEDEDDVDPVYGRCDTCGARCDAEGCTVDRHHEIALDGAAKGAT